MKGIVTVDAGVCKGCSLCVVACPKKIMELDKGTLNEKGYHAAVCVKPEDCIACGFCAVMCPDSAIKVEKEG